MWQALGALHRHQIAHGDLRASEITVDAGTALFGGFGYSEYGASEEQLQSDIAQLLVTTTAKFGAEPSVRAAIAEFGTDTVLNASRRLTRSALPTRLRRSLADPKTVMAAARDEVKHQTGANEIKAETITRFTRKQVIQLVLLVALVYVAYPFISTVPDVLQRAAHRELVVGAAGPGGLGADLYRRRGRLVGLRIGDGALPQSGDHAVRQHLRRHHHPGRGRRAGAEHPVSAEGRSRHGAGHRRGGRAAGGSGDHPRRAADLLQRRGRGLGRPVALRARA